MTDPFAAVADPSVSPGRNVGDPPGSPALPAAPYPGLRPFRQNEARLFCGRSSNRMELLDRLEDHRFLAVIGASGSGKSSLVMAGLLPDIADGLLLTVNPEACRTIYFKPGRNPFRALAKGMGDAFDAGDHDREVEELLRHGGSTMGFHKAVELLHSRHGNLPTAADSSLLVVADQFEEIFRFASLNREEVESADFMKNRNGIPVLDTVHNEAQAFVDLLLSACVPKEWNVHVVMTMRSDFLHCCEAFDRLPETISKHQYLVPRPKRDQLADSISTPATHFGARFQPGLVNLILNELAPEQDQLPILEHMLARMWHLAGTRNPAIREITIQDYRDVGGVGAALNLHGKELLGVLAKDGSPPMDEKAVGKFFRCLAEWDPTGALIRRPRTVRQIAAESGLPLTSVKRIANVFRAAPNHWLTPMNDEVAELEDEQPIDLTHESLLRKWEYFSGPGQWMDEERKRRDAFVRLLERVHEPFYADKAKVRALEFLGIKWWAIRPTDLTPLQLRRLREIFLSGTEPTEAWAQRYGGSWAESKAFLKGAIRRKEAVSVLTTSGFILVLILFGIIGYLDYRGKQAEKAVVQAKRDQDFLESIREKQEAEEKAAKEILLKDTARAESEARLKLVQTIGSAVAPILKSGDAAIASAKLQQTVLSDAILAAGSGPPPEKASIDEFKNRLDAAQRAFENISRLGDSLKEAADATKDPEMIRLEETVRKQTETAGHELESLTKNRGVWTNISAAITTRILHMETELAPLIGKSSVTPRQVQSLDSEILAATADLDAFNAISEAAYALGFEHADMAEFWPRVIPIQKALKLARETAQQASSVSIVEQTPDDAVGKLIHPHGSRITRIRFAPRVYDGKPLIASVGENPGIMFWRPNGNSLGSIPGSKNPVNDISFSPLGDAIASASNGNTVRIFRWTNLLNIDEAKGKVEAFEAHSDSITDVEFSHGGELIASASGDRTVRVFDSRTVKQRYFTSPPLPGIVTSVVFHRDDNLVVSSCDDGGVRLHTVDEPAVQLIGKFDAPARRAEFSRDGRFVVAGSGDKTALVWSIHPVKEVSRIEHTAPVTHASFRPVEENNGNAFVTTSTNGEVRLLQMEIPKSGSIGSKSTVLERRHPGAAVSAAWNHDGSKLATVGGGEVIVWEWQDKKPRAKLSIGGLHQATSRAEFSPDSRYLTAYGGDNIAYVWDLAPR